MVLDDDPVWEQHSGGSGHSGTEWGAGDALLAEAFYAALSDSAQFVFDLMMDRPGEQVSSEWIAAQLSRQFGDAAATRSRRSVSAVLSSVSQPHRRSGRRLPFYWWRQSAGATLYGMKPGVAQLFRQARQPAAGDGADPDGGDWSAAEVTAVVGDYLEMLQAEITGQRYVKAHHRRALLTRLNPARPAPRRARSRIWSGPDGGDLPAGAWQRLEALVRFADTRPTRRVRTRKGHWGRVIPVVDIAVVRPGESCAGGDFRKVARSLADCWRGVRC